MSNLIFPAAVRGLTFSVGKRMDFNTLRQEATNFYETRVKQSENPVWYYELIYNYLKDKPFDLALSLMQTDLKQMQGFYGLMGGMWDSFLFDDPDDDAVGPAVFDFAHYFWAPRFGFPLGYIIIDGSVSGHAQQVVTAPYGAVSGGSVPTWNHAGSTTNDGTLVWKDLGVAPTAGWPNGNAKLQLVQDSSSSIWYSPVQRLLGGQMYEDITDLNPYVLAGQPHPTYQLQTISVYDNGVLKTQDSATVDHDYAVIGPSLAIPGYSWMGLVIKWHITPTGPITAKFNWYHRLRFDVDQQAFDKFMDQLWSAGGIGAQVSSALKLRSSRIGDV